MGKKYEITEKTPRRWNGRPTPPVGTVIDIDHDVSYEVSLGILAPHIPGVKSDQSTSQKNKKETPKPTESERQR